LRIGSTPFPVLYEVYNDKLNGWCLNLSIGEN
jgi:hypothetical protein